MSSTPHLELLGARPGADSLADDGRNRRAVDEAFSQPRGAILVGREPVAESVPSDDRFEYQRTYPQPPPKQ